MAPKILFCRIVGACFFKGGILRRRFQAGRKNILLPVEHYRFFLTSRVVLYSARCRNRPKSSRYSPAALARSSLVLWRMEPPPERAWGCAPHTRSRSETCTTRKMLTAFSRMLWDHQCHGVHRALKPVLSCHPSQSVLPSFTPVLWHCSPVPYPPFKTRQDCRNFAFSKNLQSVQKFLRKKGEGPGGGKGSFFQKVPFPPPGNNTSLLSKRVTYPRRYCPEVPGRRK